MRLRLLILAAAASAASAHLRITSDAGGALELDGRSCELPCERDVAPGRHRIVLEKDSTRITHEIDASAGDHLEVSLVLPRVARARSIVRLNASPPCEVRVDGVFVGMTPILDAAVTPGAHVIRCSWEDGVSTERQIEIGAGETLTLSGILEPFSDRPPDE